MNNNNSEIPSQLYHYTSREVLIEHILNDCLLKIGSFKYTNDPKENKFSALVITNNGVLETRNNILGRAQCFFEDIRFNEWDILCLTRDSEYSDSDGELDDDIKIISNAFKSGSSHASMWAHYASKHSGACLVLDGKALFENIKKKLVRTEKVYYGPVTYNNVTSRELKAYQMDITGDDIEKIGDRELEMKIRGHVRHFYKELFFSKFVDWEAENEFRFLINKRNNDTKYIDLNGVLKKVILGQNFKPAYYPCVTNICSEKNIPVFFIDWQNRLPKYREIKLY